MKTDILNSYSSELKKNPYTVPEGYFESLKEGLMRSEIQAPAHRNIWEKLAPYASIAAAFAIIVTAGTFILNKTVSPEDMTYEDYIVYSDMMITEGDEDEINIITAEINEEDIIEYLIYTGVTAEVIEYSK